MLKRFMYKHPILAVLLPYIPCLVVLGGLCYFGVLDPFWACFVAVWILPLLSFPVRNTARAMVRAASLKLERDCDPYAFMEEVAFLRSRRMRFEARVSFDIQYGLGLDAAGRYQEANEWLEKCLPAAPRLHPLNRMQLALSHAVTLSHCEEKRGELPALAARLEAQYAALGFPPDFVNPFRESLDTLQETCRFYAGNLSGLREKYVARVERYNAAPIYRRMLVHSCMWLARIYEKEGSLREARAMYQYVLDRGNRLGVVEEAKGAIERLKMNNE